MGAPVTMPVWTFDIQWKLTPFTAEGVISSPKQTFELSLVEKVKRPVQKRTTREAQPTGPAEDGGEGDPDWVERLAADVNAALADPGGVEWLDDILINDEGVADDPLTRQEQ